MASGIFAVLDDIAALMDDVAVATKIATKKTATILGDDLAVNAEKATGFLSSRELPVLWKITKGSFLNKVIIVPVILLLNAYFPMAISIALILGGCYLAYEGVEKIIEFLFHRNKKGIEVIAETEQDPQAQEKAKVKSAITTDFILSIEIIILALGALDENISQTVRILAVSAVAIIATVGVYGLVALIVRMDDLGYKFIKRSNGNKGILFTLGNGLVKGLPIVVKILSVIGTIALLLVAGGIFVQKFEVITSYFNSWPTFLRDAVIGLIAGLIVVGVVSLIKLAFKKR